MQTEPAYIVGLLEKAWEISRSDTSKASAHLSSIYPLIKQFIQENKSQKNNIQFIEKVVRGAISFHDERYKDALLKLRGSLDSLTNQESARLWIGRSYGLLGIIYRQLGDRSLAIEFMLKRLEIGKQINDVHLQKDSYNTLGNFYADANEHHKAIEYYKLSVPLSRQTKEVFSLTFCFTNLSESLIQVGQYDEARSFLEEAIELTQEEYYAFPRCIPIHGLGVLETALGNFEKSLDYFEQAASLNESNGNEYTKIKIYQGWGALYLAWNKPKQAVKHFEIALSVCHKIENSALAVPILEKLAPTLYEIEEYQKAAEVYQLLHEENSRIFQEQTEFRVQNLEVKYQTETAQKEAQFLQEQNRILENKVKERTKTLAEQKNQLEILHHEKNAFFTVLAHDMRSPLTTIGLRTNLIRLHPELASEKPHYLDAILNAQKTLSQLVENIIDLEKLEAGQPISLNKKLINLTEVIEVLVDQHQNLANQDEIKLRFLAQKNNIIANVDRFQIQRIADNLISNAIKYTPIKGQVDVSLGKDATHAWITVNDTGLGIHEKGLSKIFNRYYRVDAHKRIAQGAGLGLSIVKAIVDAHQGEIKVESVPNQGTCFTVFLPLD